MIDGAVVCRCVSSRLQPKLPPSKGNTEQLDRIKKKKKKDPERKKKPRHVQCSDIPVADEENICFFLKVE